MMNCELCGRPCWPRARLDAAGKVRLTCGWCRPAGLPARAWWVDDPFGLTMVQLAGPVRLR